MLPPLPPFSHTHTSICRKVARDRAARAGVRRSHLFAHDVPVLEVPELCGVVADVPSGAVRMQAATGTIACTGEPPVHQSLHTVSKQTRRACMSVCMAMVMCECECCACSCSVLGVCSCSVLVNTWHGMC